MPACAFPIIARRFPKFPIPHHFLFLSRHFGTGVLIATAFVHLLPTAFHSLTDPCLPDFWSKRYTAMPGLVAMTAVLVVVGIEMFFATRGAGHIHGSEYDRVPEENGHAGRGARYEEMANGHMSPKRKRKSTARRFSHRPLGGDNPFRDTEEEQQLWAEAPSSTNNHALTKERLSRDDNSDSDLDLDELDPTSSANPTSLLRPGAATNHPPITPPTTTQDLPPALLAQKLLLQCLLLEAGILFHSVFIGMAVSVSTGRSFIVLLVAISFHQTFEGLALGSRIAAIPTLSPKSPKPWLMALAYGTTTPLGQAIGLMVHGLYDPQSETGLLMVGIMNAISSGLLLFAGLVELLAEDFLSVESYQTLMGRRRLQACGAVVGGAFLMALVGAWA